jgi:hypothetical protein
MSKRAGKQKRKTSRSEKSRREQVSQWLSALRTMATPLCFVVLVVVALYSLEKLKQHVQSLPVCQQPVRVELAIDDDNEWVEQEGWKPRIMQAVDFPESQPLMDAQALRLVADRLEKSGWVQEVESVQRQADGTIRMHCDFRRPIAMLEIERDHGVYYVPVDREGYRLPEVYSSLDDAGAWIRIVGVVNPDEKLPEVGERFVDEDVVAGVQLASLLFRQTFSRQICAVDMTNYRGRIDRRGAHVLVWPRSGRAFEWGSAIGQEIEEASVKAKLQKLAKCFMSEHPQARVDLTVYSNAVLLQKDQELPDAADRLASRESERRRNRLR